MSFLCNFGVFISEVIATFMSFVKFRLSSIIYKTLGLNLDSGKALLNLDSGKALLNLDSGKALSVFTL